MIKRYLWASLGVAAGLLAFATSAQAAAPVISGYDLTTKRGGGWWYDGDGAVTVKVKTDGANYTVVCDYSSLPPFGSEKKVTATNNGDKTYTCSFTPGNSGVQGGGMVILSATNTSNETTVDQPSFPTSANEMPDTSKSPMIMTNINPKTMTPPSDKADMKMGPETTDFSTITDFKKATVTMHIQKGGADFAKMTFTNIDMTDMATLKNMFQVFHLLEATANGEFKFDPNAQSTLKKANASITMYGLKDKYTSAPDILIDGKYDPEAVKGITFDVAAGTVTFSAAHFSTFEAVPKITDVTPADNSTAGETVEIKGKVNDKSATVKIKLDDVDQGSITVGSDGSFSKTLSLAIGKHTVKIDASNNIGSAVTVSRTISRPPKLTVSSPEDKLTTTDKTITVKGLTDDSSVKVTIMVNDKDQGSVTVGSDGSFSHSVTLASNSNTVKVTAEKNNVSTTVTRTVTNQSLPATGTSAYLVIGLLILLGIGLGLRFSSKT